MLRGSCLCGGVRFEITGRVSGIGQCHCSLCRKASGTASNAVLLTSTRSFRWVRGEDLAQRWGTPDRAGQHVLPCLRVAASRAPPQWQGLLGAGRALG